MRQLSTTLEQIAIGSSHINQCGKIRQFVQQLSTMAQNLNAAESNAKYESVKTINVSSEVLFAKLIKENEVRKDD